MDAIDNNGVYKWGVCVCEYGIEKNVVIEKRDAVHLVADVCQTVVDLLAFIYRDLPIGSYEKHVIVPINK